MSLALDFTAHKSRPLTLFLQDFAYLNMSNKTAEYFVRAYVILNCCADKKQVMNEGHF